MANIHALLISCFVLWLRDMTALLRAVHLLPRHEEAAVYQPRHERQGPDTVLIFRLAATDAAAGHTRLQVRLPLALARGSHGILGQSEDNLGIML